MSEAQKNKGKVFKDLHSADGIFVMPNAWNAGSACMLETAGFPAIRTTSAGISYCLGLPDYEGALTREAAMEETGRIADAVRIPVSVDAENGYGHTPPVVVPVIPRYDQDWEYFNTLTDRRQSEIVYYHCESADMNMKNDMRPMCIRTR